LYFFKLYVFAVVGHRKKSKNHYHIEKIN